MTEQRGPWLAGYCNPAKLCSKEGGGECEGSPLWWIANKARGEMEGPNCEKHAKILAARFNAVERGEIPLCKKASELGACSMFDGHGGECIRQVRPPTQSTDG